MSRAWTSIVPLRVARRLSMGMRNDDRLGAGAAPGRKGGALTARHWSEQGLARSYSKIRGLGALVLLAWIPTTALVQGVTCPTCADTISGCPGGDACPLISGPLANAAALAPGSTGKTLDVSQVLPPQLLCTFTRPVMETLSAVAKAPKGGVSADLSALSKGTDVVRSAINGLCSWEEAGLELAGRLEDATEATEITKLSAALTLLKNTGDKAGTVAQAAVQSGMGLYTFIWAKIGAHLEAVKSGTVRVLAKSAGSASSADLTAKVRRPKSYDEFSFMVFLFLRLVPALGVISFFVVHDFVWKVVFNTLHQLKEDYTVAHELLLIYFRTIETDTAKNLHLGNVFDRGNADTYLTEARQNADAFFRTSGGNPRGSEGGTKRSYSGEFTRTSKRPCVAFNFGSKHNDESLDESGRCRFNHTCMQWVNDKGPGGMCGGNHPKVRCDYDPSKRLDQPLK